MILAKRSYSLYIQRQATLSALHLQRCCIIPHGSACPLYSKIRVCFTLAANAYLEIKYSCMVAPSHTKADSRTSSAVWSIVVNTSLNGGRAEMTMSKRSTNPSREPMAPFEVTLCGSA